MRHVFAIATHMVSGMGNTTDAHWQGVCEGKTGIQQYTDPTLDAVPFMASRIATVQWQAIQAQIRSAQQLFPFEQLAAYSAGKALEELDTPLHLKDTVFILATTKGNIELLGDVADERLMLHNSAQRIATYLGITAKSVVISHACVSGVIALQYAARLLRSGQYKHAVVTGCDRFSRFVLSGFRSFQAISDEPCRPFDAARKGITLGEGAGTIVLSIQHTSSPQAQLLSGATSNDANHISGPSRTGEELATAITRALGSAGISPSLVGLISAHGTATVYNDEMESKAFDIAGLLHAPVHSFKGHIGHTLGAAGILESIMILESMKHQKLIPSAGFQDLGVPKALNITRTLQPATINYALKTASGFGGCNAVLVWGKG